MLMGTDVRSPTSTRTEVRSPTSTRTEVRSPTRTATRAYTRGNFTSTVTGGAGAGATNVTISIPGNRNGGTLGNISTSVARFNYLRWLSRADPDMYALSMANAEQNLGDYEEGLSGWLDTVVSAAVTIGGAVLVKKQADAQLALQKQQMRQDAEAANAARADALRLALIQTNTQRAALGQSPVDINNQVIPQSQLPPPTPQLAGKVEPGFFTGFSLAEIPTWGYLAGAGLLALLLLRR